MEAIFARHWIHVAVEPDIPEPGDYITVDVGRHSVVIVRDDDQQIRAFHNVCRHRGSRLCQEQQGSVGNLVCPYHQWTYTLDGKLAYAEHMGAGFDKRAHGLKPVHVQSLAGLLFICMADTPPTDFARLRDEVEPYLLPHHLNDCKIAAQIDIIEEGNWKLTMENNRECYHCAANHPELTISLFEYGFGYQPSAANAQQLADFDALSQRLESEWQADGLPSSELDCLDERITGYRVRRLPLDRAGESETLDGRVARASCWAISSAPTWAGCRSDAAQRLVPLRATTSSPSRCCRSRPKTLVRTTWLVHKDAREHEDYDVENLTAVWRATNSQDRALVEMSQQGVRNPAYQPGPYSPMPRAWWRNSATGMSAG